MSTLVASSWSDRNATGWLPIFVLWAAGLGAATQFSKMAVALPALQNLYPGTGLLLSLSVSVIGVVGIVLGVGVALILGRLGVKRCLVGALLLGAALSAFQATIPAFPMLLASRIVEGTAHLAIVVGAPTLMTMLSAPGQRAVVMGIWGTFFGVAFALAGWFGIPLVAHAGVQNLFASHATYMALMAVLVLVLVPSPEPAHSARQIGFTWQSFLKSHREVYGRQTTMLPAASYFWHALMFVSLLTFLPYAVFAHDRLLAATLLPLAVVFGTVCAGILAQRLMSARRVTLVGYVVLAVLALGMPAALETPWGLPLAVTVMFVSGLIQGASFAMIPELCNMQADRTAANGALAQTGTLGVTLGIPCFALASQGFGNLGMGATVVVFASLGAVLLTATGWRAQATQSV